ncbi:MAG: 30S ribosomal protein S6 [Clostridia bacterium]|nr:30S ribosomal protein S6 [Clostridia bacterium]
MNNYETIFVINPSLDEEATKAVVEKFKTLIEQNGTVESVDEWGKRRLAYPINYITEGYYVLVNFASEAQFPAELERIYKITDDIIRSIVVKK